MSYITRNTDGWCSYLCFMFFRFSVSDYCIIVFFSLTACCNNGQGDILLFLLFLLAYTIHHISVCVIFILRHSAISFQQTIHKTICICSASTSSMICWICQNYIFKLNSRGYIFFVPCTFCISMFFGWLSFI